MYIARILFILLIATVCWGKTHQIFYKDTIIGEVNDLNKQLKQKDYLVLSVKNFLLKVIYGQKVIVYNNKDSIKNIENGSKIYKKKDKINIINLLKLFTENKKQSDIVKSHINGKYEIKIEKTASSKKYNYKFFKNGKLKNEGSVLLNNEGIDYIKDDISEVLIKTKKV